MFWKMRACRRFWPESCYHKASTGPLKFSIGLVSKRVCTIFRRSFPERPDVAITVDSGVWREIVVGLRNPALAFASGAVQVEGSKLDLIGFLRLFD